MKKTLLFLVSILLATAIPCYSGRKYLTGVVAFTKARDFEVIERRLIEFSSTTVNYEWEAPSSYYVKLYSKVAISTTPAHAVVSINDCSCNCGDWTSDNDFVSLLSYATNYIYIKNSDILFCDLRLHDCRNTPVNCNCKNAQRWVK